MRRSLGFLVAGSLLLGAPAVGSAEELEAKSVKLPKLPLRNHDFRGTISQGRVLIWTNVVDHRHKRTRIWQLRGKKWKILRRAAKRPPIAPVVSTEQHVDATAYDYAADLNALLVRPDDVTSGYRPTRPAFSWDPFEFEFVHGFTALGSPLRLVLYRATNRTRSYIVTPFRSLDGGETWSPGATTSTSENDGDAYGGGRLYALEHGFAVDPETMAFAWSADLGVSWHRRAIAPAGGRLEVDHQRPGYLAIVGRRILASEDGGETLTAVLRVPRSAEVFTSWDEFGEWLVIGSSTVRRVTLTE